MLQKIAISYLLVGFLFAQPHHDFKNWMVDEGYVDGFSLYHAGIGGVKTTINELFWWGNERWGWWNYRPSTFGQVGANLLLSLAWELGEFGVEGDWSWRKYDKMYNGHALENNLFDVFLDMAVFCIPHYKGLYYEIRYAGEDLSMGFTWAI